MKYGIGLVLAVALSLLIIYWLRPLNAGATGLVVVVCVAIIEALIAATSWIKNRRTNS